MTGPVQRPASNSNARKAAAEKALAGSSDGMVKALFSDPNAVVTEAQVRAVADFHTQAVLAALATTPEGLTCCLIAVDCLAHHHDTPVAVEGVETVEACPACGVELREDGACWWCDDEPVRAETSPIPLTDENAGVETVEWGVHHPDGIEENRLPEHLARLSVERHPERTLVRRTVTRYPDRVSEWSPVEPETSEPEGGESRGD